MIKVFGSMAEYVTFMTGLSVTRAERFCVSFVPSAFFPKDSIEEYFRAADPISEYATVTANLWSFGRKVIRQLAKNEIEIGIEANALVRMIGEGRVHNAVPRFEIGFATRIHALKQMRKAAENHRLFIIQEAIPFVFRLHPPSGVLMDVSNNNGLQKVQGLWLDGDETAFLSFESEFNRLREAGSSIKGSSLVHWIDHAIENLNQGRAFVPAWD